MVADKQKMERKDQSGLEKNASGTLHGKKGSKLCDMDQG